jgi:hypothetical protein
MGALSAPRVLEQISIVEVGRQHDPEAGREPRTTPGASPILGGRPSKSFGGSFRPTPTAILQYPTTATSTARRTTRTSPTETCPSAYPPGSATTRGGAE